MINTLANVCEKKNRFDLFCSMRNVCAILSHEKVTQSTARINKGVEAIYIHITAFLWGFSCTCTDIAEPRLVT